MVKFYNNNFNRIIKKSQVLLLVKYLIIKIQNLYSSRHYHKLNIKIGSKMLII